MSLSVCFVCVCVCFYVHVFVCVCLCASVWIFVCVSACVSACPYMTSMCLCAKTSCSLLDQAGVILFIFTLTFDISFAYLLPLHQWTASIVFVRQLERLPFCRKHIAVNITVWQYRWKWGIQLNCCSFCFFFRSPNKAVPPSRRSGKHLNNVVLHFKHTALCSSFYVCCLEDMLFFLSPFQLCEPCWINNGDLLLRDGLHLYSAILTSGHSKRCTILPHIHPFMHTFTHRRRCQPCKATASSSGAVRVRCLAQGHLDNQLGGAGDRTSNLPVTSQTALSRSESSLLAKEGGTS